MTSLTDRIPDPPKSWTDTHQPGDVLEGTVLARKAYEKNGDTFIVIVVDPGNGAPVDLPLFRTDLAGLAKTVREGDRVAVKFWGQVGPKFVYTHATDREQSTLTSVDPAGRQAPPQEPPAASGGDW